jgi:ankyrin repeat protein
MSSFASDYDSAGNDITELLEKCGSKLNTSEPGWMLRLSFGAVSIETIKTMVEAMGKVVINIGDGLTLLHLAGQCNRPDWMHYLVGEKQHPLEVRTIHGETPLDQAAWRGNIEAAMVLLRYGADVDCQTDLGYSPLHRCAYYDHPQLGSLLCLAGANQTLRDTENQETAYEVAAKKRNRRLMKLLNPTYDADGNNISGCMYASNNPKHPNFRPEARDALFTLCALEMGISGTGNQEEGEEEDDDSVWEDMDDDEDGEAEEDDEELDDHEEDDGNRQHEAEE